MNKREQLIHEKGRREGYALGYTKGKEEGRVEENKARCADQELRKIEASIRLISSTASYQEGVTKLLMSVNGQL